MTFLLTLILFARKLQLYILLSEAHIFIGLTIEIQTFIFPQKVPVVIFESQLITEEYLIQLIMRQVLKNQRANDSNFILRAFFVHCFMHIYQIITAIDPTNVFKPPRFDLFSPITLRFTKGPHHLFRNLLLTYKWHILRGGLMTCIFVFFNLLMPELIRMFMHFMHEQHSEKSEVMEASIFIRNIVGVQVLRLVFGEHTRRIFYELAIKTQSSLARKLIQKSLNLSQKAKKDIPRSEILQLENVDLKLVFTMFNNMMFIFQAPLTIFVALIMLFVENRTYGFIGAYWFLIAFLLHRQLDQKMTHCNATKLGLIDKRSKVNYQMLFGMREARMIGWQDVMIEKNNDYFEEENHDHHLFYFYNSLYDIILLMLPVLVVVTICVWDMGEAKHITVEQVYMMLSLLGICYQPMKSFRTISISFHDGLHSLHRLEQYFAMPDQKVDPNFVSEDVEVGKLVIEKDTASAYPGSVFDFFVKTNFKIEINPGERFTLIGRKGQGRTAFLNMIHGFMERIQGSVKINGKKAIIGENFFFLKASVRDNIAFYNQNVSQAYLEKTCEDLQIAQELKATGGLRSVMTDVNKFSKSLLQRISIARILCSEAQIYILDRPFDYLQEKFQLRVQKMFRKKQLNEKVTIIMSMGDVGYEEDQDKVGIIQNGIVKEYGLYDELLNNPNSKISNFFKSKEQKEMLMSPIRKGLGSPLKNKFKQAVRKVTALNNMTKLIQPVKINQLGMPESRKVQKSFSMLTNILNTSSIFMRQQKEPQKPLITTFSLLKRFIFCVPITEILLIMIIIACAELMHVFIHFFIGHMEEEHGESGYYQFRNMMLLQVVLTMGLAGVLYYEGEVSSLIAIIQGNQMYKSSLYSLINKKISYFVSEYPVKIADRFNHDYEEVFIACHGLLTIYKNLIILIVTVVFISSDGYTVLVFFTVIIFLYTAIYLVFRKVEKKIIAHYYDYKYGFVKCFEESLEGAEYFKIFDCQGYLLKRAERKYRKLASYKLAEKNTNHGLTIACDLMGNFLLASIVYYGLESKVHHTRSNMALIATSIHLLMNGSQVLKNILKETINFETFFRINLVPFLEVIEERDSHYLNKDNCERPKGHQIKFDSIILMEPGEMKARPLNLKIKQGQHIFIHEPNESFRNLLLFALTKNLSSTHQHMDKTQGEVGSISLGWADIHRIHPDQLFKMVGVIMNNNFYFTGTLRENLVRKIVVDEEEVDQYIKELKIDEDIEDYDRYGLESKIFYENTKVNYELTKKFAILRILLYRCKIVIIKDTTSFVGTVSIVDLIRKYIPDCTIIKINASIEASLDAERIIAMENSVILEQGTPQQLMQKPTSTIGNLLKDLNMEDYLFKNQCSRAKISGRFRMKRLSMMKKLAQAH